jgi:glyoxylase I family protein
VAFRADPPAEVDDRAEWLRTRGAVESGPKEYHQYRPGYYAVFFYDPDGVYQGLRGCHLPVIMSHLQLGDFGAASGLR